MVPNEIIEIVQNRISEMLGSAKVREILLKRKISDNLSNEDIAELMINMAIATLAGSGV